MLSHSQSFTRCIKYIQMKYLSTKVRSNDSKKILIIGAGMQGINTAYYLLQSNPNLKITIIDKELPITGTSMQNAGTISI